MHYKYVLQALCIPPGCKRYGSGVGDTSANNAPLWPISAQYLDTNDTRIEDNREEITAFKSSLHSFGTLVSTDYKSQHC